MQGVFKEIGYLVAMPKGGHDEIGTSDPVKEISNRVRTKVESVEER